MDNEYVSFGDVARKRLNMQCQYASRYVTHMEGYPDLGEGLRILNPDKCDYHAIKIHKDDVEEFVARVKKYRFDNGIV